MLFKDGQMYPKRWIVKNCDYSKLCQSDEGHQYLECGIVIHSDFTCHLLYYTARVPNSDVLLSIPSAIITSASVCKEVFELLDTLPLCSRNPDEKFISLAETRKGVFTNGKFTVKVSMYLILNFQALKQQHFMTIRKGQFFQQMYHFCG